MTISWSENERHWMHRALELAARGQGFVEPNPMVGCVIVGENTVVGEGWHQRFGGPHAEVEALRLAGGAARGGTMYVTLEPCCHHGKTPPCVDAILAAGLRRVVIAEVDPFPLVDGGGIVRLRQAGVDVAIGLLEDQAHELNAPFHKLIVTGRPWIIAKWAMSLDGKIATSSGESQWITNESSRALVHKLRGSVDAILVGRRTVSADDPLLTARPPGPRLASRIVLVSQGNLPRNCRLLQSVQEAPVIVVTAVDIASEQQWHLHSAGCEVLPLAGATWHERLLQLLDELGRRRMTNVLVEGGTETLGGFFEQQLIDEVHVFVGQQVIGGNTAPGPIGGQGTAKLSNALKLQRCHWENLDGDLHFCGRTQ